MKISLLTVLALSVIILASCDKKTKCDGYAPEGTEISWTDYNSSETVINYFKYRYTAQMHSDDTVLVCGYVVGDGDTNYYCSLYEERHHFVDVCLTDDSSKCNVGNRNADRRNSLYLRGRLGEMEWLKEYHAGQKAYVKGLCISNFTVYKDDCSFEPSLVVSNVILE